MLDLAQQDSPQASGRPELSAIKCPLFYGDLLQQLQEAHAVPANYKERCPEASSTEFMLPGSPPPPQELASLRAPALNQIESFSG